MKLARSFSCFGSVTLIYLYHDDYSGPKSCLRRIRTAPSPKTEAQSSLLYNKILTFAIFLCKVKVAFYSDSCL